MSSLVTGASGSSSPSLPDGMAPSSSKASGQAAARLITMAQGLLV